jgi:hypothetical protein
MSKRNIFEDSMRSNTWLKSRFTPVTEVRAGRMRLQSNLKLKAKNKQLVSDKSDGAAADFERINPMLSSGATAVGQLIELKNP